MKQDGTMVILAPYAEMTRQVSEQEKAAPKKVESLRGRNVGILNNHWMSMDIIAERLAAQLKERLGVKSVLERDLNMAAAVPPATVKEFLDHTDLAIVGLGN